MFLELPREGLLSALSWVPGKIASQLMVRNWEQRILHLPDRPLFNACFSGPWNPRKLGICSCLDCLAGKADAELPGPPLSAAEVPNSPKMGHGGVSDAPSPDRVEGRSCSVSP